MTSLQSLAHSVMVAEPNWTSCWMAWAGTRRTMYVRSWTSMKFRLICWNQVPCLIEIEALHAEGHTALWHGHRQPSLTLASTDQDTCDLHIQHTTLLVISPTSFQNWTPTSWSLNKNAMNNLLGKLFLIKRSRKDPMLTTHYKRYCRILTSVIKLAKKIL